MGECGCPSRERQLLRHHVWLVRDLRHDKRAAGAHESRHLLREHAGRHAESPGGRHGLVSATDQHAGARSLEHTSRAHRRRGWHCGGRAHVLHGVVPLAPLPERRLGCLRPLRRERRQGPHGGEPPGVRQLLRVGRLPQRGAARVPARSARRRRHGPVAPRRRAADRLAPQMGHCRRRRLTDERRLCRPDHRRCLGDGCPQFRRRPGPEVHGQGGDPERDRPWTRDRAAVPQPVPVPALRQCGIARPDIHRLLHRRFRHPRIRH